jgi:6-phosphogluconate dehydrogenase
VAAPCYFSGHTRGIPIALFPSCCWLALWSLRLSDSWRASPRERNGGCETWSFAGLDGAVIELGAGGKSQGEDATACVTHVGPGGSGHYVKMVHNGIEYADMQFIAEAYDLMRAVGGMTHEAVAAHFRTWNDGRLQSYLFEITADILVKVRGEK